MFKSLAIHILTYVYWQSNSLIGIHSETCTPASQFKRTAFYFTQVTGYLKQIFSNRVLRLSNFGFAFKFFKQNMSHKPNNVLQPKENAFIKPVAGISSSGASNAIQQKQLLLTKKVSIVESSKIIPTLYCILYTCMHVANS